MPTVSYGNLTLYTKVSLDTATDQGRIKEAQDEFNISGEPASAAVVSKVCRELAIKETMNMKREVDKVLGASTYTLAIAKELK